MTAGTRFTAPPNSVDQIDRLIALFTAGMNFWYTQGSRTSSKTGRTERSKVEVLRRDLEHCFAPFPVERLHDHVALVSARKASISGGSRVISVVGGDHNPGNSVTEYFPGALRTCAGSLTTSVRG